VNGNHAMSNNELSEADPTDDADADGARQYRWLAHELHDGLLQWVVGGRMQIEAALAKLDKDSVATANLDQAIVHLLNALTEGRSLIGFLDHQEIGDCDVVASIAHFVDAMQSLVEQRGQTLHLELPSPSWPAISKQHAWSVLRFVQQAVQNAIQHAGPTSIVVQLEWLDTELAATGGQRDLSDEREAGEQSESVIRVMVEDQGRGFDSTIQPLAGHFGLQSLQQRAKMCGGRFRLKTSLGAGCRATLEVPINNEFPL